MLLHVCEGSELCVYVCMYVCTYFECNGRTVPAKLAHDAECKCMYVSSVDQGKKGRLPSLGSALCSLVPNSLHSGATGDRGCQLHVLCLWDGMEGRETPA